MIEPGKILSILAKERPVFHSEADFQHAFAWAIHKEFRGATVRLELPLQIKDQPLHIDIWVVLRGNIIGFELKYLTRKLSKELNGELFQLKNQSAQDIRRYDFIKDIKRLENIAVERKNFTGYAILLTNDGSYWSKPSIQGTIDCKFRLQEGRILEGMLAWGKEASKGTTEGREQALTLNGRYKVLWKDYSTEGFRSLTVRVG